MSSSSEQVLPGDVFTLTLTMNPTTSIGGWQLDLQYDHTRLQATNVSPGSDWASYFDPGSINTTAGTITAIQTWKTGPFPATSHIMCTISFTAIQAGSCDITMDHVQVTDSSFNTIPVAIHNISLSIGDTNPGGNHGDGGYLVDDNGDGVYDDYHNNATGNVTHVQQQGTHRYLIDKNGDGLWDTQYDSQTKTYTSYTTSHEGIPLVPVLGGALVVLLVFIVIIVFLLRRRKK